MKIFIFFTTVLALSKSAEWTYEGADSWSSKYPLCGGKSQTPINIQTTSEASCGTSTLNVAYLNDPVKAVTVKFKKCLKYFY